MNAPGIAGGNRGTCQSGRGRFSNRVRGAGSGKDTTGARRKLDGGTHTMPSSESRCAACDACGRRSPQRSAIPRIAATFYRAGTRAPGTRAARSQARLVRDAIAARRALALHPDKTLIV